jgi:hypothetical protein
MARTLGSAFPARGCDDLGTGTVHTRMLESHAAFGFAQVF